MSQRQSTLRATSSGPNNLVTPVTNRHSLRSRRCGPSGTSVGWELRSLRKQNLILTDFVFVNSEFRLNRVPLHLAQNCFALSVDPQPVFLFLRSRRRGSSGTNTGWAASPSSGVQVQDFFFKLLTLHYCILHPLVWRAHVWVTSSPFLLLLFFPPPPPPGRIPSRRRAQKPNLMLALPPPSSLFFLLPSPLSLSCYANSETPSPPSPSPTAAIKQFFDLPPLLPFLL